jgi:hypothetical protein
LHNLFESHELPLSALTWRSDHEWLHTKLAILTHTLNCDKLLIQHLQQNFIKYDKKLWFLLAFKFLDFRIF